MLVDVHNHIGTSPDEGQSSPELIRSNMEKFGIDHAVVFAIDEPGTGPTFEDLNTQALGLKKSDPRRFGAFGRIVPSTGQPGIDDFKRCLDGGVRGLKLKGKDGFEPSAAQPILDLIPEDRPFPVLIHTSIKPGSSPKEWEPVIVRYPHINFILAHGGKDRYRDCARMAKDLPNVYCDTTTLSFHRSRVIYRTCGAGKILFASDTPYSHPAVEIQKWECILEEAENDSDKNQIFYQNAQRLLGINV